jgi:hypothetical protein
MLPIYETTYRQERESDMKRSTIVSMAISAGLIAITCTGGEPVNQDEVLRLLQELQRTVATQQDEISNLKAELAAQRQRDGSAIDAAMQQAVDMAVDERLEAEGLAQLKDAGSITLGKDISGLKIKGDLRLRYERRERHDADAGDDGGERDRYRQRARVGLVWDSEENDTQVGLGIATGGSDATSTNDTFSDKAVFETGDLRLDYAYAKQTFDAVTVTLGQQKNPFKTSKVFWDGDVRPAGLTVQTDTDSFFATTGLYDVMHIGSNESDAILWGTQLGTSFESDGAAGTLAIAYYHFNSATTDSVAGGLDLGDVEDDNGDGDLDAGEIIGADFDGPVNGIPAGLDNSYDFQILDLYGQVKFDLGDVDMKVFGQFARNLGADGAVNTGQRPGTAADPIDPEDAEDAWVLGVEGKTGPVKLGYQYARIEADSLYGVLKDSDFGAGGGLSSTDIKGHIFKAGYSFNSQLSLNGTVMLVDRIELSTDKDEANLYQLDLSYKF